MELIVAEQLPEDFWISKSLSLDACSASPAKIFGKTSAARELALLDRPRLREAPAISFS